MGAIYGPTSPTNPNGLESYASEQSQNAVIAGKASAEELATLSAVVDTKASASALASEAANRIAVDVANAIIAANALAAHEADPDAHDLSGITQTIDLNRQAAEAAIAAEADARIAGDDATASIANDVLDAFNSHANRDDNPHHVTAAQAGAYATTQVDTLLAGKANITALAGYLPILGGTLTTGANGELKFAPASGTGIAQHGFGETNYRWAIGSGVVSNGLPSLVLNYNGNSSTAAAAGVAIAATNTRQLSLYTSNGTALTERVRVTSAGRVLLGASVPTDDNSNALQVNGGVAASGPILPGTYTVATLPTPGTARRIAYASNARNAGEGAAAGTGSIVVDNGTAWRIPGTTTAVTA